MPVGPDEVGGVADEPGPLRGRAPGEGVERDAEVRRGRPQRPGRLAVDVQAPVQGGEAAVVVAGPGEAVAALDLARAALADRAPAVGDPGLRDDLEHAAP